MIAAQSFDLDYISHVIYAVHPMTRKDKIIPGQVFGHWTVIEEIPLSRGVARRFLCTCVCGVEKQVYYSHLKRGASKSCGCKNPRGPKHYKWTGHGEIPGAYWKKIIATAEGRRGRSPVPITISIKFAWNLFLNQNRKCALSGVDLEFGKQQTASLDRIDSNLGYTKNNVQWVHKDINKMKNVFPNDYFIEMCRKVSDVCELPLGS